MTRKEIIKQWYIRFALINLGLSIIGFCVAGKVPLEERIVIFFVTNLGYHMMYGFCGFIPRYQLAILSIFIDKNSLMYDFAFSILKLFSAILMAIGILFMLMLVFKIIFSNQYHMFFSLAAPIGITLGGAALGNYLKTI